MRGDAIPHDMRRELRLNNGHRPTTFTAVDLMALKMPKINYVVPDILPEGVTILGGKPKLGKSWMTLQIAIAVATGGLALGTKRVEAGEVLYLSLEDHKRRLQRRLDKLLNGEPPAGLHLAVEWPRADEGGVEAIDAFLRNHPGVRLVVIDTLARFKPRTSARRSQYDEDRDAVDPLAPLVADHGIAIVVVHHLREMESDDPLDMIHGSAGTTGGVDGVLVLKRKRGTADAFMVVEGRDIEHPAELALNFDSETATWKIVGDAAEYRLSEGRRAILDALHNSDEPLGPKDITATINEKGVDMKYGAVREMLSQMVKDGQVKNVGRGRYTVPDLHKRPDIADKLTGEENF